ncbi:c-type cytochrome [Segetibacter aerophilus]|uniref:Cytochrome c n=1 Tax=Segetibacter aerophilus TaxID=670293 RepID=A0A512BCC8_9BACT|nr:cytochrome c [Segetibacter aerophilus]GEO09623.1 cytochrome c [Segetibacter aerophilus]
MKKLAIISVFALSGLLIMSCGDNSKPGLDYMPDMKNSRAYETYADHGNLSNKGVTYNNRPVAGTVSRGEELPYHLNNDSIGYAQSATYADPLPKLNETEMEEAERLYLINCAICHGTALDGNGPLYKGGTGPFAAKPAMLVGDAKYEALSEGTLYHVMTYGKNLMGSYASQLSRKQRWMVAQYVKSKQGGGGSAPAAGADSTATASASGGTQAMAK